jgi:hypothetical protein
MILDSATRTAKRLRSLVKEAQTILENGLLDCKTASRTQLARINQMQIDNLELGI